MTAQECALPGLVGDKEPAKEQAGRESYVKARRILLKPVVISVDGVDCARYARCRQDRARVCGPHPRCSSLISSTWLFVPVLCRIDLSCALNVL